MEAGDWEFGKCNAREASGEASFDYFRWSCFLMISWDNCCWKGICILNCLCIIFALNWYIFF